MRVFEWEFLWSNGMSVKMPVPFAPSQDLVLTPSSEWVDKLCEYYPKLRTTTVEGEVFSMVVINPPREAEPEEVHHWEKLGYKEET